MATHSSILAWEMPRTEEPDGPQSMGRIKVGLNPATTNRSNSKDHTQVCVCVCVCVCVSVSPLAVLESVSESSCISASVSPDSQPPARSSGPGLSQALWFWLRSLRRPAVSLGVGACECLCVCLCACLWLVCSLRKVEGLAWGQRGGLGSAKGRGGGAPVDRASLASAGFGHRTGAGQVGRSSFAAPRPAGASEAPGPRGLGGGGRRRPTHPGPRGPEQRMGSGGGPAQPARPGLELPRVGGRRDLRTPQPSPQAPRARTHARPPGQWGLLEDPRAPGPGQALAGLVLVVFGGRAAVSRPESGDRSCGSSTARPPTRGAARWPDLQGRAKGRRSPRLLGRPAPTASGSGPISLKAPDLV